MERYNRNAEGNHFMKSLDDLIAEDKTRLKKKTDQLRGKDYSKNQGFQRKGIHKPNRSFDRKKSHKIYNTQGNYN